MSTKRSYSVAEVAEALGLSRTTVDRRIADGSIPSLKLGHRRLIPADAFEDLLRRGPNERGDASNRRRWTDEPELHDRLDVLTDTVNEIHSMLTHLDGWDNAPETGQEVTA